MRKASLFNIKLAIYILDQTPGLLHADNVGALEDGSVDHLANALVKGIDLSRMTKRARKSKYTCSRMGAVVGRTI
jgi:hypothetical protein